MSSYGRTATGTVATSLQVLADGRTDGMKVGGITIDWATVTAVSGSDVTLNDGTVIKIGDKYLRYGTIIDLIASTANGGTVGKYGPANTAATDGRQTLARGESYILNSTVVMSDLGSDNPAVFDEGTAYHARLLTNEAVGSAGNPTDANVLAAFPAVRLVK